MSYFPRSTLKWLKSHSLFPILALKKNQSLFPKVGNINIQDILSLNVISHLATENSQYFPSSVVLIIEALLFISHWTRCCNQLLWSPLIITRNRLNSIESTFSFCLVTISSILLICVHHGDRCGNSIQLTKFPKCITLWFWTVSDWLGWILVDRSPKSFLDTVRMYVIDVLSITPIGCNLKESWGALQRGLWIQTRSGFTAHGICDTLHIILFNSTTGTPSSSAKRNRLLLKAQSQHISMQKKSVRVSFRVFEINVYICTLILLSLKRKVVAVLQTSKHSLFCVRKILNGKFLPQFGKDHHCSLSAWGSGKYHGIKKLAQDWAWGPVFRSQFCCNAAVLLLQKSFHHSESYYPHL